MSLSINSLSSVYGGKIGSCQCSTLSAATRRKLEELGIDPSTVTSEAEAQALIAQAEAAKHKQNEVSVTGSQNNVFNAMDMVSISNKYALGL